MSQYKPRFIEEVFLVLRHSLRTPIALSSVAICGCVGYVMYKAATVPTDDSIGSVLSELNRENFWPSLLHPFDGGLFAALLRAAVFILLAAAIGGSWFTYIDRQNFKLSRFISFATGGYPLVLLLGIAGLISVFSAGASWINMMLAAPLMAVVLYAVYGILAKERSVSEPLYMHETLISATNETEHSGRYDGHRKNYDVVRSTKTFASIVGMQELKTRLRTAANEIQSRKSGARNGILLFGEPGNGKTMFAEALAGELKLPIISVSYGDVASKWINQTTEQVMAVFASARAQTPCVLFIDEIDSLISSRDSNSTGYEEAAHTTNAILTEIVKLRGTGVIFVGATNYLEKLDAAAIREGRFDYKIEITAPDQPARESIVAASFAKHAPRGATLEKDVLARAAKRWSGFSASRMSAVGQEMATQAKAGESVSFASLIKAMRTIQGRAGKIADDVPTLDAMSLTAAMRGPLKQLAVRMENIVEIEEMGGSVPRGVLFRGPAGTGKTLTAQALAKTAGWGFLSAAGSDLVRDPAKIDKLFRDAAEIRPCVIFLDESDDLLQDREYSSSPDATNKFLTVMDGAGGKTPDVMIIAATNYPERLDPATLRGGRFTEKIDFTVSDVLQAEALITHWLATLRLPTAPSLSNEQLVALLHGHSPANINAVLQLVVDTVAVRSLEGGEKMIRIDDVEQALKIVV